MQTCRFCAKTHLLPFLDLGAAPFSNAYLTEQALVEPEKYYPLSLNVCTTCWLVQTGVDIKADTLFTPDYAYFSSTSTSWLKHARDYVEMVVPKLKLNETSFVIEIASNDGYLLKNFVEKKIPCVGIEPTHQTADHAISLGVPTKKCFFNKQLASELKQENKKADLIIGNNVLAHVPDIHDFVSSMRECLKPQGMITLEFPHLLALMRDVQFDTVYHEHYSYFSLYTVQKICSHYGLKVVDAEPLITHGGSLRLFVAHECDLRQTMPSVGGLLRQELEYGLLNEKSYHSFQTRSDAIKNGVLSFLLEKQKLGRKVAAYGAAAKGNTLLNYAGIKPNLLPVVYDAAPSKQGKFLPGSRIPILHPEKIKEFRPDFVIILPWNLASEVKEQLHFISEWGGEFVTFAASR